MATAALSPPAEPTRYRLAPLTLVRVPLLRLDEARSSAWDEVRRLLAVQHRLDATMQAFAPRVAGRLVAEEVAFLDQKRARKQLLAAVRDGIRPRAGTLRTLQAMRTARLVARAWARRERIGAQLAQAIERAAERDIAELRALHRRPEWQRALALANPEIAAQARRVLARGGSARRDRVTLRMLRRLAWRAAGRAAPMALFSATARLSEDTGASVDAAAAAPRALRIGVRSAALGVAGRGADPILDPAAAEADAWRAALTDLTLLPHAANASRWRELAEGLARGGAAEPLSHDEARALWIESRLGKDVALPRDALEAPFSAIARLGSALAGAPRRHWAERLGLPESGRAAFAPLAATIEQDLCRTFGAERVAGLPLAALLGEDEASDPARALVERALRGNGRIALDAAAALGTPAVPPRRAAFRARPVGDARAPGLAITHWGGDSMSVLAGYADVFAEQDAPAAMRAWIGGFPGCADLAIGSAEAADRRQRLAPRRIVATPRAAGDIAIEALEVTWGRGGTRLAAGGGAPILRALHTGLAGEQALPFAARLLLHITRPPPSVIEQLLAAVNRALAERIAGWLDDPQAAPALALPPLAIGDRVVLAPDAFLLRGCADAGWDATAAAWRALGGAGCPIGLAEMRAAGGLAEPRTVDLATRDGVALALGSDGFVHLTPLTPAPGSAWLAEFCVELVAR